MPTTTHTTTANSLKINGEQFFNVQDAKQYISINNISVEDYVDLQKMIASNSTLIEVEIISPENPQHLITSYIDSNDVAYEEARVQLQILLHTQMV